MSSAGRADLHLHTYYSDGTDSPERLIERAVAAGVQCVAVCDHDTIEGVLPTSEIGKENGIEVIPGVELSTSANGKDVHILGYFYDFDCREFNDYLVRVQNARVERMAMMIDLLDKNGVKGITLEEVRELAGEGTIGRPHLARIMVERGAVKNMQTAFDNYLADDQCCFIKEFSISPQKGIELIKRAGGLAVMAHPMVTKVDELIPSFVEAGLDGMEVVYPNQSTNILNFYRGIAEKHGLLLTGGSDGHGDAKRTTYLGKVTVDYEWVEILKSRVAVKG